MTDVDLAGAQRLVVRLIAAAEIQIGDLPRRQAELGGLVAV
jgi:hypothetical protein